MRCAACNVVLDPGRIAAGEDRCVCGVVLDLPDRASTRADVPVDDAFPSAPPNATALELMSYREAPPPVAPIAKVLDLAHVGTDLACPRCRGPLSYAFEGSYDVHECRGCFGAFVDASALATFIADARTSGVVDVGIDRLAGPHPDVPVDGFSRCPSCKTLMNRAVFGRRSGVLVDVCVDHGTWFDAGELAKVLRFEATGGAARVAQKEEEEAKARQLDPKLARKQAGTQVILMQERARETQTVGRFVDSFRDGRGFLDWLDFFR